MQPDKRIIQLLNAQLKMELTAINQYFLHARMYRQWLIDKVGLKNYLQTQMETGSPS